jgi:hypothetical protein
LLIISFLKFLNNFLINFLLNSDYMTIIEILCSRDRDNVEIRYIGVTPASVLLERGERNVFPPSGVLLFGILFLLL